MAASAAPSAQDTPGLPDVGSEFGEEEDVKPSVEYLDSLNDYRKRSRSVEDVGEGSGSTKMPRTANGTPETNGTPAVATIIADVEMHSEVVVEVVATSGAGDPMVNGASFRPRFDRLYHSLTDVPLLVNGSPIPLSQITEEHQELMTPEEYTTYYEILSAQ